MVLYVIFRAFFVIELLSKVHKKNIIVKAIYSTLCLESKMKNLSIFNTIKIHIRQN